MHHIAGSIEEWVQEEEAKYQADILAKEVERHAKEIAETIVRITAPKRGVLRRG